MLSNSNPFKALVTRLLDAARKLAEVTDNQYWVTLRHAEELARGGESMSAWERKNRVGQMSLSLTPEEVKILVEGP